MKKKYVVSVYLPVASGYLLVLSSFLIILISLSPPPTHTHIHKIESLSSISIVFEMRTKVFRFIIFLGEIINLKKLMEKVSVFLFNRGEKQTVLAANHQ